MAASGGAAGTARRAGGETLQVTLNLLDVSGTPIRDPETFFTFRRLTGNHQVGDQQQLELVGAPVAFAVPVMTSEVLVCEIDPKRFRFAHSPVFFASPGPPVAKDCRLFREPKEWLAQFPPWNDLSAAFDGLKGVLSVSPMVTLFKEATPLADLLVEAAYDGMSGEQVALAKTALLNSYFRLSRTPEPLSGARLPGRPDSERPLERCELALQGRKRSPAGVA